MTIKGTFLKISKKARTEAASSLFEKLPKKLLFGFDGGT
jgi:hypothetical protein